ncbi:SMI1/KNR4 family protein [Actinomadura sp. NTSP31]|uniref:SMI1/KNR4 family protein n=1 Tax=Actinomadura sp. NTSP31 TaxID=1735447 RepID=UPI0035BF729C
MADISADLALPTALAEVAAIGFEWEWDEETDEGRGCDFELYEHFEKPDRTAWWFRLWTGNQEADGSEFRFFGTTGAGDYTGFWLVRPGAPVTDQPVVHIGSEGERGVLARDLGDLLWLFAAGLGPAEAMDDPASTAEPNDAFRVIAERHAPGRARPPAQIVNDARTEFPHFSDLIDAMCR